MPKTLFEKIWDAHLVERQDDGTCLIYIDRHLVHEGSHHAFARLAARQLPVAEPALTFAVVDHYAHAADWEQECFDNAVTDWEIARGFERA